ncbi:hypothetical protein AB0903_24295 [Streptomyces sp. NPDC048389]
MSATVEINTQATDDEIEVVEDLDAIAGTDVMLGCGNDNPF